MINEHDIKDMLPDLASKLVMKSSGDSVPDAAIPSLVKFMQEVAEYTASYVDSYGDFTMGNNIRRHFGTNSGRAFLLRKHPVIVKSQMELDLECGK